MRAYLFILPIELVEVGRVYVSLPLHCTLMLWFWVNATPQELIEKTGALFAQYGPVELVSEAPALFGKQDNIPVHTLIPNPVLKSLHERLLAILDGMDATYVDREYVGQGFNPHVTTKGDRSFRPGSHHVVHKVCLFEGLDVEKLTDKKAIAELPLH